MVRKSACQGALTERQTLGGGGAHERGHGAPLEPIAQLSDTLRGVGAAAIVVEAAELVAAQAANVGSGIVSGGVDTKASPLGRRCTPQVGDLRLLEDGGERGGAVNSDRVASETASEEQSGDGERSGVSMGPLTRKRTLGSRFERRAAYSSDRRVKLPLRPSAIAAPPSGPRSLYTRL